jgi:hypothetical protein
MAARRWWELVECAWVNWWACWWRKSASFCAWKVIMWWLCCCTCWHAVVALHVAISASRQGGGGCCNNQPAHRRKYVFSIPSCQVLPPPGGCAARWLTPWPPTLARPLPVQCPQPSSEPTQTQCYHANASLLVYSESTNCIHGARCLGLTCCRRTCPLAPPSNAMHANTPTTRTNCRLDRNVTYTPQSVAIRHPASVHTCQARSIQRPCVCYMQQRRHDATGLGMPLGIDTTPASQRHTL